MKVIAPQSFTYEGGNQAVLLLHGFTGSTAGVKGLGNYLQHQGYTTHAPLYKGHGVTPEALIQTGPKDWWHDVVAGYDFLKSNGYQKIAVVGISLGAVFALKLSQERSVNGIVSISAPLSNKTENDLNDRVIDYAKGYKVMAGKKAAQITEEMTTFENVPMSALKDIQQLILNTKKQVQHVEVPIRIMAGALDEQLYHDSANYLYNTVNTNDKRLKWFEKSGHVPTLGPERDHVNEAILEFLNTLDW